MGPSSADMGMPRAMDQSVAVDRGQMPMEMLYPDESLFESEVLPILQTQCGSCHESSVNLSDNSPPAPGPNQWQLDPNNISDSVAEVVAFINPESPSDSVLLRFHDPDGYGTIQNPMQNRLIEDWIADTLVPKTSTTSGPSGPSAIGCDRLPLGDGIGPPGWYAEFESVVNPMFVGTLELPDGYCNGPGCHTDTDVDENSFYILPAEDPCSARWNFFVSQSFLNLDDPSASPLVRKPLGEPGINMHGGQQVFSGQDENYLLLLNWIQQIAR